jgi:hypothetical protein
MASHDGLRLYLGKYAPDEVLKHIFAYGFHLWLARPVDMWEDYFAPAPIPCEATRPLVLSYMLSESARQMVGYREHYLPAFALEYVTGMARPRVFENFEWCPPGDNRYRGDFLTWEDRDSYIDDDM